MVKLWKWLYKYSQKMIREEHLNKHHIDIKCPNCKQWFSISGIEHRHVNEPMDWGSVCSCGNCGHLSYWNQEAFPFPVLCDANGNILAEKSE